MSLPFVLVYKIGGRVGVATVMAVPASSGIFDRIAIVWVVAIVLVVVVVVVAISGILDLIIITTVWVVVVIGVVVVVLFVQVETTIRVTSVHVVDHLLRCLLKLISEGCLLQGPFNSFV